MASIFRTPLTITEEVISFRRPLLCSSWYFVLFKSDIQYSVVIKDGSINSQSRISRHLVVDEAFQIKLPYHVKFTKYVW